MTDPWAIRKPNGLNQPKLCPFEHKVLTPCLTKIWIATVKAIDVAEPLPYKKSMDRSARMYNEIVIHSTRSFRIRKGWW